MPQSSTPKARLPIHRRAETSEELVGSLIRQLSQELKLTAEVFDTPSAEDFAIKHGIDSGQFIDAIWAQLSIDDMLKIINRCGYHVRVTLEPIPDA